MEQSFSTMFEDVRHERSLILLLSLKDPDISRKSKITDDEKEITKNLVLGKLNRQRIFKEQFAMHLLEEQFSNCKMTSCPSLNNEPDLLKIKTGTDGITNLKCQTEIHDPEKILKSPQIDNKYYKKKYKSLNQKKILLIITEILVGSASTVGSSTMGFD